MTTVQEIQHAIRQLSRFQREELAEWILNSADFGDRVAETALAYGDLRGSRRLTMDEYLKLEERSSVRHEYIAGEIFAMMDPSLRHEVIVGNLFAEFHRHVRDGPCWAVPSNATVFLRVGRDDILYYPDIMIARGSLSNEELNRPFLTDPCVVVEVLSPSTEAIDRREKALNYRHLPSLEEYVLVAQRSLEVTIYRRSAEWVPEVLTAPEAVAQFRSIGLCMSIAQIYERAR